MPTIYDLFGIPLSDRSPAAEATRKARRCPFMGDNCDGGGNRHQTKIALTPTEPLTSYFDPSISSVIPGVCSIQSGQDFWVVCPRRLLGARHTAAGRPATNHALQPYERRLLIESGLPTGIDIGIWSEVTLKYVTAGSEINYHFDYLAAPLQVTSLTHIAAAENGDAQSLDELLKIAKSKRLFPARQKDVANAHLTLPDLASPFILEVMTASTSGSNTEAGTDIASAFRYAILGASHSSPGINKRQVWGRMATQLFAKTALAAAWGGKAVWIVQDELLRNIELTTRLNTSDTPSDPARNINLVVMHYEVLPDGSRSMSFKQKLSGDAGIDFSGSNTFTDILLPSTVPGKLELLKAVLRCDLAAVVNL